jgi:hypothetical protein
MKANSSIRSIVLIWFGWAIIILAFQSFVQMRISLERPDNVISWTSSETGKTRNFGKDFLSDPFLNGHVAWDSEYYLAIAVDGYNSTRIRAIPENFRSDQAHSFFCKTPGPYCFSLSNAFFPVYSILTKLVAFPLSLFKLTKIATATLAAVIVSLLGTLTAMLSLFSLFKKDLGEDGGVRAAFYFLIFPSSFFLAQVYSEGVFLGLIFAALALINARKWVWAAIISALAVWARPGGAILLLPLLIIWITDRTWKQGFKVAVIKLLAVLSPAISYLIWRLTPLAKAFFVVESQFFGRGLLALNSTKSVWSYAWHLMQTGASTTRFYYGLEFTAILLTLLTCVLILRKRPELGLFGLAIVLFAFTTGAAQGMVRYVLAAPPLFYMTSRWGKNQVFDRVWTLACVLIMALELTLFTFDFWVA